MKTILHKAETRGHKNHGWLNTYHTFSFANYFDPERIHFGALRVLNDDTVIGGEGFGTHAHDNMEIISIPLEGDLEHRDSMGNVQIINHGDVQVMSAGTGITHSEMNKNEDKEVKFLQIWVFPNKHNVTPKYNQITLNVEERKNKFQQIVSPNPKDEGAWIYQNAWFHLADFDEGTSKIYEFKKKDNGLYIFVLKGKLTVGEQELIARDGYGVWETGKVTITANDNAEFLLMEIPMF
ncbi:MAG: pirin family protein [Prevotellaceae bacterium]|jgi:redox-sensitive bicupin YhaK (pirin superfamily)|nr:pirin family protein [Prevotellaceae bacterium]